jgi:uncharacterized flavoprotein (TIGR03862 family)
MAAEVLASGGAAVDLYDKMASPGRKLLLAGRGGLNLTHSEDFELLLSRYGRAAERLRPALEAFSPRDVRTWCEAFGQPTFIGSSGRVFPKAFKTSPLLRAWLKNLQSLGVIFKPRQEWTGWDSLGALTFKGPEGSSSVTADATILALGGASWPQLGSDGRWTAILAENGVATAPLRAANGGFLAEWSRHFKDRFEGQPLKGIELVFKGNHTRGEALITRTGLEGGGIYALSAILREAIEARDEAILTINLRPDFTRADLEQRLEHRNPKQSLSTFLRKAAGLSPAAIGLLQEVNFAAPTPLTGQSAKELAGLIQALPLRLIGSAPIARAISSAGGIKFVEIDANFMLLRRPGTFVAGEMLDWEAPTGGYLLQASFATGRAAGRGALDWVREKQLS